MYVKARVTANARKESFVDESGTLFTISVREKAERNAANARVIELIAAHLRVPRGRVRIVNGHHSPSKLLYVDDATA